MSADDDAVIYRRHRGELVRYAASLVGPDDAPDVLSSVITRVLARRDLADLEEPKLYLMKAVLNECRSVARTRGRRQVVAMDPTGSVGLPEVDDVVLAAVLDLPMRQRAATYLVYWGGYSANEAVALMGCRPATLRRYLYLARSKLEGVLDVD